MTTALALRANTLPAPQAGRLESYLQTVGRIPVLTPEAEQALAETTADILVLTGEYDTTVSQDVGILVIEKGLGNNNWVHMPKATHLIPYDIDTAIREEAMERTVSWLSL